MAGGGAETRASARDTRVTVTSTDGRSIVADGCVVSVPLPVLQQGLLSFEPPLPPHQRAAMNMIVAEPMVKVLLLVNERI